METTEQTNQATLPQDPLVVPEKKTNPLTVVILLIVILLIMAGAVYTGIMIGRKQTSPNQIISQPVVPTSVPEPTTTSAVDETANWKTYKSEKLGFEIEYPLEYSSLVEGPISVIFAERLEGAVINDVIGRVTVYKNPGFGWVCTRKISSEDVLIGGIKVQLEIHEELDSQCKNPTGSFQAGIFLNNKGTTWFLRLSIDKSKEADELKAFKEMLSTFKFLE